MTSTYTQITHDEMWAAMQNIVSNLPEGVEIFSVTNNFSRGEETYELKGNSEYTLRIYTSIRKDTRRGRDLGKDAIRLVVVATETTPHGFIVERWHHHLCRIYRTEGWQVRLHNRILEANEKYPIMKNPIQQLQDHIRECFFCGDPEVNGMTEDGKPVCAWHQHVVWGVDLGNKPDRGVIAQFKEGKLVAFSYLGRA